MGRMCLKCSAPHVTHVMNLMVAIVVEYKLRFSKYLCAVLKNIIRMMVYWLARN